MSAHYLVCPGSCDHLEPVDLSDSRAGFRALVNHIRNHEVGLTRLNRSEVFRFALQATVLNADAARTRTEQRCQLRENHAPHWSPTPSRRGGDALCFGAGRMRTVPPMPETHEPSPEATQ